MSVNDNALLLRKRSGSEKRQRGKGAILVRLLPDERATLEERARETGLSLASFLRACGLGVPGPRAKRRPPVDAEALARATAALNKTGSNLNQIAHILNAGQAAGARESVEALNETRAAIARILEIVGRKDRP
jgi:hypothetical protein